MNLFVCSSPFHVFNAVNIVSNFKKSEISDIYILNIGETSIQIYNNIKNKKVFRKVYLINVYDALPKKKIFYYVNRVNKLLFTKKIIPNSEETYDNVFIVGTEIFSKAIYAYWLSKNKNTSLYYFEDGTASYFSVLMKNQNSINEKLFYFFKHFKTLDKCKGLYVYRPECVVSIYNNIEIKSIPLIEKSGLKTKKIKEIFLNDEKSIFENNLIFFDSNFGEKSILKKQYEYFNLIEENISEKEISVKLHPGTSTNQYGNNYNKINHSIGFEMFNLNHDMNDKILISVISSANLIPKLIYDEEPYVIYLYNLIKDEKKYPHFDLFVENVKKTYSNPEKVFVPKTILEFKDILNKLNVAKKL